MQVPFRNGLLQYTCVGGNINIPSFLTRTSFLGGYKINIRVDGVSLMGTISHLQKEYMISIAVSKPEAWSFSDNNTHYLFLGYDNKGQVTYKDSTVPPSYGPTEPAPTVTPQYFFNTAANCWKEWTGGFWQVVDLLYVGSCTQSIISHNIRGTYGGQNIPYQTGYLVYNQSGKVILLSDRTFLTTTDDVVTKDWSISTTKLEYSLMLFETNQTIGAYTCMKMLSSGNLSIAGPHDVGEYFICLTLSSSVAAQLVDVTHYGIVSNNSWNWQSIGTPIYINITGELTDQNPYVTGATTINATPVARTLSSDSIIFSPPFVPSTGASGGGNGTILEGDNINIEESGDEFTISLADSPALAGTPTTPTPTINTNNTQIANTEFVKDSIDYFYENSLLGRVWKWTPDTQYYAARVISSADSAPDIIFYDDQLFVVIQDFMSSTIFSEKSGANVVMLKLSSDSDIDYLELMMQANSPLSLNQEIGSYLCVRDFVIDKQHTFPNSRLGVLSTIHKALCNSNITSDNIVSINRTNSAGDVDTIGTITFTVGNTNGIGTIGTLAFNDSSNLVSPTTRLLFSKGDILSMVLTTKSGDLTWLKINMLGTYVKFISPWFE